MKKMSHFKRCQQLLCLKSKGPTVVAQIWTLNWSALSAFCQFISVKYLNEGVGDDVTMCVIKADTFYIFITHHLSPSSHNSAVNMKSVKHDTLNKQFTLGLIPASYLHRY